MKEPYLMFQLLIFFFIFIGDVLFLTKSTLTVHIALNIRVLNIFPFGRWGNRSKSNLFFRWLLYCFRCSDCLCKFWWGSIERFMLWNQKFITWYVVLLGFEGMFGEIIDYIWVYHAVLLLPEDLGGVIVMFAWHLIAFHCAVS